MQREVNNEVELDEDVPAIEGEDGSFFLIVQGVNLKNNGEEMLLIGKNGSVVIRSII